MSVPAIELRNASIRRGGRTVWSDASLEVAQGEFVAVLGPNGAGKSTLLDVLLGLEKTASGSVGVLGSPPGLHNERIGYLPQRHGVDAGLRIRGVDLVRLGLDGNRFGLPLRARASSRERVSETIAMVGAASYERRAIGELSGGEQQRLLIAQALVGRPELLFLDEPLDGLDLPNQTAVSALLSRISHSQDVTILLVAHDVNPLLPYIDRVVYVAGGKILAGTPDDVIASETLSALYGVRVEVLRASDGRLVVVGEPEAPPHHGAHHH
ncbi:MAG TPA: ABC transporter ATP-binding protein [Gaiellaceae bacterium]|nr:ABC transporter ATP-binding protein [Gaiellaceae bacterium]